MRTPIIAGGFLAAALMSSTAFAQTPTPSTATPPAATPAAAPADIAPKGAQGHWRSSKLIGVKIYNDQNDRLGDINEVILDPSGKVTGYVVGVGGFLGMGEHDILVEPSKIKFLNEPARTASTSTTTTSTRAPATDTAPTNTRPVSNTSGAATRTTEQWYPDHGVLSATKEQLKAMPQFKYSTYN